MLDPKLTVYIDNLRNIGLSEKEARVYLALLGEGVANAEEAARRAELNRSTTYVQLESLIEKGLATTFKRGKKTCFMAESPTHIERLLEHSVWELEAKRTEAKQMLPELLKLYTKTGIRPLVRSFEGKEGLKTMRNNVLQSGTKDVYVAVDFDDLHNIFTQDELTEFSVTRAEKGITTHVLYNKKVDDIVAYPPQEVKYVPKERFPFPTDVYIYGDTVSLATRGTDISGVTIVHQEIARTMKTLFDLAWDSAK